MILKLSEKLQYRIQKLSLYTNYPLWTTEEVTHFLTSFLRRGNQHVAAIMQGPWEVLPQIKRKEGKGEEGGKFEDYSVLLLPLHQMFTLHPHWKEMITGYTIIWVIDNHQVPQSNGAERRFCWVGALMKQILVASCPSPCVSLSPNFQSYRKGSVTIQY